MLLHQTPLFDLHYEPATDILRMNMPDVNEARVLEIGGSLAQMQGIITTYFISRLLIDGSLTTHLLEVDQILHIWRQLIDSVSDTKLKKIARIRSHHPAREALAEEVIRQIDPVSSYPNLQFAQFNTEAEAEMWLMEEAG
jgi:ABC-type siderophore export system fused ATPase/permease subunit